MRLKPNGSLDLDWQERRPSYRPGPWTADDYEWMREEVISELMRDHPTLTREKAEAQLAHIL
jgi:hypothetical protein